MANPDRRPGKTGALPRDPRRAVLYVEDYLEPWNGPVRVPGVRALEGAYIPPVPYTEDIDRASFVSDWPMYCNGPDVANPPEIPDGVGDCTIAQPAHSFSAQRVYAGYREPEFSSAAILSAYSACGGYVLGDESTDNGCDPTVVASYLQKTGMVDVNGYTHKYAGWAVFRNPGNLPLMAACLDTYGTLGVAITCDQAQEDQFSSGQPWQYVPGSPDLGGHMIGFQRRRFGGVGILEYATWGAIQNATRSFARHQITEVILPVSEDWITVNGTTIQGMNLGQLLDDMAAVD